MKERPILFSDPMVKAILEGRKTKTRRIIKFKDLKRNPDNDPWYRDHIWSWRNKSGLWTDHTQDGLLKKCPYGIQGDHLWVRESWAWNTGKLACHKEFIQYRADGEPLIWDQRWHPSIHMFRWMSRITLKIKTIHVERLQDISEEDAEKEGVDFLRHIPDADETLSAKQLFECLWCSINGEGSWNSNPYVFVIEFEKIKP